MSPQLRHFWWHRPNDGYFAVATDTDGEIVSVWLQVGDHEWEPIDDFGPLREADAIGEIHKNRLGYTDSLGSSRGAVQ